MFDKLKKDRALDLARLTVRRLLSARGEGNAQGMAVKLIEHYEKLDEARKFVFCFCPASSTRALLSCTRSRGNLQRSVWSWDDPRL